MGSGSASSSSNPVASHPRRWWWDALRTPELGFPSHGHTGVRPGQVLLPHFSPRHGNGWVGVRGPDAKDLARWTFGLRALARPAYQDRREVAALGQALRDIDRDRVRAQLAPQIRERKQATRSAQAHQTTLAQALHDGLMLRVGDQLAGSDESTFIHLAARVAEPRGIRVCEQCALVFVAPRAKRCSRCRDNPVRIQLHEAHIECMVGDRFGSDSRTVHYWGECQGCGGEFHSTDSRQRHCENCKRGAGRTRRFRGGTRTGRQRFRFRGQPDLQTISFTWGPSGRTVALHATAGVIETDDADIARYLTEQFSDQVTLESSD